TLKCLRTMAWTRPASRASCGRCSRVESASSGLGGMYPQHILHWIDEAEVVSATGATFEKRCPIDDRIIGQVTRGTASDVARAVDAAAAAADAWGRLPAPRRG